MITRLAELNRVLIVVRDLRDRRGRARIDAVVRQCSSTAIEAQLPDHQETIAFAERIGLIRVQRGSVSLTDDADVFLSLNGDDAYELTGDQQRLLLRTVYLNGVFRRGVLSLIRAFEPAFDRKTFRWSAIDGAPLDGDGEHILRHLRELGLVGHDGDVFEVVETYVDALAALLAEGKGWTEEALEEFLRERREVGGIAEDLVLRSERERLRSEGCEVEAQCVRPVSRLKVDAGYDIESFHAASRGLHYDRFIEVKGSKGAEVRFIWSENEMRIAKKLGARYWLYFQGGIDVKRGTARNKVLMFQDPAISILRDPRFTVTQHGVIVQAALRGEPVTAG